ncbi:hypothetical protein N0V90_012865 [Kalmusia sp. IMI 367209]|nr:hypothetical protein N0V90_012865 [Kalmusia sp. IMI 367209]
MADIYFEEANHQQGLIAAPQQGDPPAPLPAARRNRERAPRPKRFVIRDQEWLMTFYRARVKVLTVHVLGHIVQAWIMDLFRNPPIEYRGGNGLNRHNMPWWPRNIAYMHPFDLLGKDLETLAVNMLLHEQWTSQRMINRLAMISLNLVHRGRRSVFQTKNGYCRREHAVEVLHDLFGVAQIRENCMFGHGDPYIIVDWKSIKDKRDHARCPEHPWAIDLFREPALEYRYTRRRRPSNEHFDPAAGALFQEQPNGHGPVYAHAEAVPQWHPNPRDLGAQLDVALPPTLPQPPHALNHEFMPDNHLANYAPQPAVPQPPHAFNYEIVPDNNLVNHMPHPAAVPHAPYAFDHGFVPDNNNNNNNNMAQPAVPYAPHDFNHNVVPENNFANYAPGPDVPHPMGDNQYDPMFGNGHAHPTLPENDLFNQHGMFIDENMFHQVDMINPNGLINQNEMNNHDGMINQDVMMTLDDVLGAVDANDGNGMNGHNGIINGNGMDLDHGMIDQDNMSNDIDMFIQEGLPHQDGQLNEDDQLDLDGSLNQDDQLNEAEQLDLEDVLNQDGLPNQDGQLNELDLDDWLKQEGLLNQDGQPNEADQPNQAGQLNLGDLGDLDGNITLDDFSLHDLIDYDVHSGANQGDLSFLYMYPQYEVPNSGSQHNTNG